MVRLLLDVKGKQHEPPFLVNINESLKNHFPEYQKYQFVLHEDKLYLTTTIVKEFIKDEQDTLVVVAVSDEEIVQKYNEQNSLNSFPKLQIVLSTQLSQQKDKADLEQQKYQRVLKENRQYKQFLDECQNCPAKKCSNNTSCFEQQSEGQKQESKSSSGKIDLSKSQKIQSQTKAQLDDQKEFQQNYLFICGQLENFYLEEQELSHTALNNMLKSELQTVNFKCLYCQLELNSNFIFTNCLHAYHEECLLLSIKAQLEDNPLICQFACLCQKKIQPQLIQLFQNKQQSQMLTKKIFDNQLKEIKSGKKHQYIKCSNQSQQCDYFYINTNDAKINTFNCPVCSEIIQNQ